MSESVKGELDLRSYFKAFQRRKALFILIFLLVFGSTVAGVSMREKPPDLPTMYLSSTEILVTPPAPSDVPKETESLNTWFASEKLFKQLILSEDVLTRVKKKLSTPAELDELRGAIAIAPTEQGDDLVNLWDSFLVRVDVETLDSERSQEIAEVLTKEVIEYTQELAAREVIASRKALEKMALNSKKAMEEAQRQIIDWRKQNDVWDIDQLVEAQGSRIAELEARREDQKQMLMEERKRLAELTSYENGQVENLPWEVVSLKSAELSKLSEERNRLRAELDQLRKVYTDSNQRVQEKLKEYGESEAAYSYERQSLVSSLVQSQAAKVAETEATLQMIDRSLLKLKNDQSLADSQVELQQLKNNLENHRLNLQNLTDQINEARVQEQKQRHLAAFTVVQKPQPGTPIALPMDQSKGFESLLGALVLGLAAASLCTYGAEFFAVGMRLRPQVEKNLGLPILGSLPRLNEEQSDSVSIVEDSPDALISERFRSIVVNLIRQEKKINKVLVTSCWPGEGKSFVSINLATALARFDLSVTLLDGDLRRPRLSQDLDKLESPGFRQFLKRELPLEELAVSTEVENLNFLPAGTGSENSAELLARMRSLDPLAGDDEGRFMVIDSSPLSVCSDSVQMADQVDGIILVIGAEQWEGEAEVEHVLNLEDQGVKVLGVVLNGVHERELHYGYKSYLSRYYETERKSPKKKLLFWK